MCTLPMLVQKGNDLSKAYIILGRSQSHSQPSLGLSVTELRWTIIF